MNDSYLSMIQIFCLWRKILLLSKHKLADEKRLVQRVNFETFKDMKLLLWMFMFFKNALIVV